MTRGLQSMAGGLRGQQGWGEMLHVHPRPVGTASGSAERGAEGMEGGWVLVALLWLLLCRAWEGEESPCPYVEPAQGMPCRGAPLPPSFPCSETLPRALAQLPPTLIHVECRRAMGKLGPEGWTGVAGGC